MNIVLVITSLECGGAERVTANLANAWAARGWQVAIVTLTRAESDFYPLHPAVTRMALDMVGDAGGAIAGLVANLRRTWALRRTLHRLRPEVVVGMATTGAVLGLVASVGKRWPLVAVEQIHPPLYPLGTVWETLRRWTYRRATCLVALTSEGRDWLRERIPGSRVEVIFNPVTLPLPNLPPLLPPDRVVAPQRRLLLAVGRLMPEKGFDRLLPAFASLAVRHPDWDLVVLGEGPLRDALMRQIDALGLAGRVAMPGRAGNIADWYVRADLYVMSSRVEGFPNVLIEAMAQGCPVVSYDCDTGPRDIIRDGVDGLLVRPTGDVEALGRALSSVMADDALRAGMASRATEAAERFSMARNLALWDALLQEVRR